VRAKDSRRFFSQARRFPARKAVQISKLIYAQDDLPFSLVYSADLMGSSNFISSRNRRGLNKPASGIALWKNLWNG
jgi:hypothetical protein